MEQWKRIEGFSGKYEISSNGQIRRSDTRKLLKDIDNGSGYKKITLCFASKWRREYIHRLVAKAFVPNPSNYSEVNHIDGNPSNNAASNLEWVTSSENTKHAVYKKALAPWGHSAKPIIAISSDEQTIFAFATISEAERYFNSRHIVDVLKGRRNHVKGYRFVYMKGGGANVRFEYREAK